jgi:acetyl esterase/lipase
MPSPVKPRSVGATAGADEGYGVISPRFQARRAAPALLAALALLLVALAAPVARAAPAVEAGEPVDSTPQLLLIHGGSFLFEDAFFEAETAAPAIAAGFVPHYLSYPLDDLPGAVLAARAAARELRERYGPSVYAYGSSAGGTLAALLAGDALVAGAVAKAPPSDLVGWEWPLSAYGLDYYERIGLGSGEARYRLSPLRRPAKRPLLLVHGRNDRIVPIAQSEAFAAKFRRVHLWAVPGGHRTEQTRPWVLEGAMGWLHNVAFAQAPSASS